MPAKRVLLLVNGLGLGNSTRCYAVIQRLARKGVEIQVVTSGNGVWFFPGKPEVAAIHTIKSLAYGADLKGRISILKTFAHIGEMIKTLTSNSGLIETVIREFDPQVVVTDSDYNIFPVRRAKKPVVALNNADVVRQSFYKFGNAPGHVKPQFYAVECLDYLFHRTFADVVVSPTLDPTLEEPGGNIRRVGPIIREGFHPVAPGDPKNVVIMLSGSNFGVPVHLKRDSYPFRIDVLGREVPQGWKPKPNIEFHGKVADTYPFLKKADLVVVNCGFSAVSELLCMRKPMVVVPIPRHAEQWVNAHTIKNLGIGELAVENEFEEVMMRAFDQIEKYRSAYEHLTFPCDGGERAAEIIYDMCE